MIPWLLAGTFLLSPFFPRSDPWFAKDKVQHFSLSFIIYSGAEQWYRSHRWPDARSQSLTITIGLGVLKELVDWRIRGTGFSWKDLLYDVAGAVTASVMR